MNAPLKIKVCGNKDAKNLEQVCSLQPDFVGLIFYEKSKRVVDTKALKRIPENCVAKRVGVFVNAPIEEIKRKVKTYGLDYVQLHGDETPDFCHKVSQIRPVFKAFQIYDNFNFSNLNNYISRSYMFVFDTASKGYGGSGKKFNWELLAAYNGPVPFLLSGGIGPEDVEAVKGLHHPMLAGVDINSRFETEPGIKDIDKLGSFIKQMRE